MWFVRALALVGLVSVASVRGVHAQVPPEPDEGRLRLGDSVSITPAMSLVTGYDTNLIRTQTGEAGSEYYLVPQVEGWVGRGRVKLYFVSAIEYGDQTTAAPQVNQFYLGRFTTDGPVVQFSAQASHRDHYAPPTDYIGFETGLRSRRVENIVEGSAFMTPRGRLNFGLTGRLAQLRYDADATYEGVSLQQSLNRDLTSFEGTAAVVLTPMTSLAASGGPFYDRFLYAPERDGNGYRAYAGAQFTPRALVGGRAMVGIMTFKTLSTGQSYSGPTYNIGLTASKGPVLFDVTATRIVDFSFDSTKGFFISDNLDTYLGIRTKSGWDLLGRATFGTLSPEGLPPGEDASSQQVWNMRGAVARRLIYMSRLGVEVERYYYGGDGGFSGTRVIAFLTFGTERLQKLDRPVPGAF